MTRISTKRSIPRPNTPLQGCPPYELDTSALVGALNVLSEERARNARLFATCSERGMWSASFADTLKVGLDHIDPNIQLPPPPSAWSFPGTIPTIVITPPSVVKREIRALRLRQNRAEARRLRVLARKQRAEALRRLTPPEEKPYIKAFYEEVAQGWRKMPTSFKDYHREITIFRRAWVREHNKLKVLVKVPIVDTPKRVFATPPPQGKAVKRRTPEWRKDTSERYTDEELLNRSEQTTVSRSPVLLLKLRTLISAMRSDRIRQRVLASFLRTRVVLKKAASLRRLITMKRKRRLYESPEMDDGKDGGSQVKCHPSSNVTLQTHTEESTVTLKPNRGKLVKVAGGDDLRSYTHLTDRWIEVNNFTWSADQPTNTVLMDTIEPKTSVVNNDNSSNFLPLHVHQYGRFDMEFRAAVNATSVMTGALQMSWYPCSLEDANSNDRREVAMNSQLPHVIVDAAAANDGVISVPYYHYQTFISTKYRNDLAPPLSLGALRILVLNPLRMATGAPTSCSVTVYIRFTDVQLMGMTATDVGSIHEVQEPGEMLPMLAVTAAQSVLNQIAADQNRDRPPYQGSRMAIEPTASQSLCLGDQVTEPLNSMRLDARGQTPHPEYDGYDEMLISNIVSRYGLISQFTISTDNNVGDLIYSAEVSPIMSIDKYWHTLKDGKKIYDIPPLAAVSGMFGASHGPINYKFQFISSVYHSCRLMFVYIPHNLVGVSKTQARSSPNVTFDLGSQREFVFTCPYMSTRPYWPHRLSTGVDADAFKPNGTLYVYLQNKLLTANNMPAEVACNVYVAAGPGFELAYPVQPAFGLSYDCKAYIPNKKYIAAREGNYPYYLAWWRYAYLHGKYRVTFAYGGNTGDIVQFSNENDASPSVYNYYVFENPDDAKRMEVQYKDKHGDLKTSYKFYYVVYSDNDTYGPVYLIAYESVSDISADFYTKDTTGRYKLKPLKQVTYANAIEYFAESQWQQGNPHLVGTTIPSPASFEDSFEFCEGDERFDTATSSCLAVPDPATPSHGNLLWGERFLDLKSLCRRYQQYLAFTTTVLATKGSDLNILCDFPVLPQGLDIDYQRDAHASARREGIIPLVASAYRGFVGSLNLKFIFIAKEKIVFYIQHKPDRACTRTTVSMRARTSMDSQMLHGYSTIYVDPSINRQITVNVPYYQLGAMGLLQRPNINRMPSATCNFHFSLGNITILYDSLVKQDVKLRVLYSFGDDMRFNQFVGFPKLCAVRDFENPDLRLSQPETPEMDEPEVLQNLTLNSKLMLDTKPTTSTVTQSWTSSLLKWFTQPVIDEMSEAVKEFKQEFNISLDIPRLINLFISNSAHCILSPTLGHFAVFIASALAEIGIIAWSTVSTTIQLLVTLLNKYGLSSEHPQAAGEDESALELVSVLFAGIGTICGVTNVDYTRGKMHSARSIVKVIQDIARSHIGITSLFKAFMHIISKIITYIQRDIFGKSITQYYMAKTPDIINKYYSEAIILLNPAFEEQLLTDETQYARLDTCVYVGSLLLRDITVADRTVKVVPTLLQTHSKLLTLRDRAHKNNIALNKRREPYCLHLTGAPGIGKSQMVESLLSVLFTSQGINPKGSRLYVYTAGSKHWDGYINQPAVLIDDLRCLKEPTAEVEEFSTIFKLKSCAPFRPPQADIQDKGRFCAPEILFINSNIPYPHSNSLASPTALYRRYDDLIYVSLTPEVCKLVANISTISNIDILKNNNIDVSKFEHLHFSIKSSPHDPSSSMRGPFSYSEICSYLKNSFSSFRKHQFTLYNAVSSPSVFLHEDPSVALKTFLQDKIRDPLVFRLYKKFVKHFIPVDIPQDEVAELCDEIFEAEDEKTMTPYDQGKRLDTYINNSIQSLPSTSSGEIVSLEDYTMMKSHGASNIKSYNQIVSLFRELNKVFSNHIPGLNQEIKPPTVTSKYASCEHILEKIIEYYVDPEVGCYRKFNDDSEVPFHCSDISTCCLSNTQYRQYLVKELSVHQGWIFNLSLYPSLLNPCKKEADVLKNLPKPEELKKTIQECVMSFSNYNMYSRLSKLQKVILYVILPSTIVLGTMRLSSLITDQVTSVFSNKKSCTPAKRVYKSVLNSRDASPVEIVPSGDNRTASARNSTRGIVRRIPQGVEMHEEPELNTPEHLRDMIVRNTFFLIFSGESTSMKGEIIRISARCLGIFSHYAVFPRHYLVFYLGLKSESRTCTYFSDTAPIVLDLMSLNRWEIEEDELCIVELPKSIPLFRDIRSQILPFDRLNRPLPRQAWFTEVSSDKYVLFVPVNIEPKNDVCIRVDEVDVLVAQGIGYNYHGKGKCGSVVVTAAENGKIIAMHISGREGSGTGSYLYREMFDFLIKTDDVSKDQFYKQIDRYNNGSTASPSHKIEGAFVDLGVVENSLAHRQSGDSSITKSLIHDLFPATTDKAILSSRHPLAGGVDPLEAGTAKQGKPVCNIPVEYSEIAIDDLRRSVFTEVAPIMDVVTPLTIMEACNGVPLMHLKKLELRTSEGFGWARCRPPGTPSNKRWLFSLDTDDNIIGLRKDLADIIVRGIEAREAGNIQATVFTNCLKDARLPLAKIKPDKTRVFSVAPIEFTIIVRMYFAHFFSSWQKSRLEHSVGMAVQKSEWTDLGVRMGGFSPYHLCGDYSAFGDTLDPGLVSAAFDIAIDWLEKYESRCLSPDKCKKNRRVRQCIKHEIVNSVHLCGNMLLQTHCGAPSGSPITVDINSLVGCLYIRVVWLHVFRNIPHFAPMDKLHSLVKWKVYGDDVWMAVKPEVISLFNNETISNAFRQMGIKYTDATKSDTITKYSTFEEVTFLKHRFIPHPKRAGRFLAALDQNSVRDCALWCKNVKNEDYVGATQESATAAMMLAYGWGPTFYGELGVKIKAACLNQNVPILIRPWNQLDEMFNISDMYENKFPLEILDYSNPEDVITMYKRLGYIES